MGATLHFRNTRLARAFAVLSEAGRYTDRAIWCAAATAKPSQIAALELFARSTEQRYAADMGETPMAHRVRTDAVVSKS